MGGLAHARSRFTWAMMLIGTLALTGVGIPHLGGFAGFLSKDAIIEAAYAAHTAGNYAFWLLVIAAFMTAFYSWRLIFMTFHGTHARRPRDLRARAREPVRDAGRRCCVLAVGAVARRLRLPALLHRRGLQASSGARRSFEGQDNHILHAMHEVPGWVGWAPFVAMAARASALAYLYYIAAPCAAGGDRARVPAALPVPAQQVVLRRALRLPLRAPGDAGSAASCGRAATARSSTASGPTASPRACCGRTGRVVRLQTGYVYHYAFAMLIGVALHRHLVHVLRRGWR